MKDLLKDDKCKKGYSKMTLPAELFRYSEAGQLPRIHKPGIRYCR